MSQYKTCVECGRIGTRGFFKHLLRSTEENTVWKCLSARSCDERQYQRWVERR